MTIRSLIYSALLILSPQVLANPTAITNVKGYHIIPDGGLQQFDTLVFEQGKVLANGNAELLKRYPNATVVDGQGQTLLPGLTDAHGHLLGLGENLMQVDLRGLPSEKAAVAKVKSYQASNPSLNWIVGRGWNQVLWPGKAFPTASQLDEFIPDKPVWLERVDGHAAWVNSKALQLAGIGKDTLDPPGGQIIRDDKGNPTGVLIDNAMWLVAEHLPKSDAAMMQASLKAATEHLLSLGITSMHDAGVDQKTYDFYQQQAKDGQLQVRIYGMLSAADPKLKEMLEAGPFQDTEDMLWVRSVKAFADGALGSRGAAMLEAYSDDTHNHGLLLTSEEDLPALFELVLGKGFQLNVHAIGDRGNRLVLDNFAQAYDKVGGQSFRNRIEHAQVVSLEDIPRFKDLNIIASMQPVHATSDMNMAEDRIGKERLKGAYAWQTFLKQGTVLAAGSDFPVELANAFHGLHAAVTRQDHEGKPPGGWIPAERLSVEQALRAFTLDAAYAAHQEKVLGNLESGKWADFILIDRNIFEVPNTEIWQTQVLQTWIAGQQQFQRAE